MKKTFFLLIFCCSCSTIYGQDFNLTQLKNAPLLLGPQMALTPSSVNFLHRSEGIQLSQPIYTDFALMGNKKLTIGNQHFGLGVSTGLGIYGEITNMKSIGLSIAHQLNVWSRENKTIKINTGIESRLQSLSYQESDIRWPNPNFLYTSVQSQLYPDISAGTALQFSTSKYNFQIGYTLIHINQPVLKVINTSSQKKIRHQAFLIGDFNINSKIRLEPQCLVTKYDLFNYYNGGMNVSYAYNDKMRLIIGGGKSISNHFVNVGTEYRKFRLGICYVFPSEESRLGRALEGTLSYRIDQ